MNTNEVSQKILDNKEDHICECGKSYRHMSSLCKHKKTCQLIVKPIQGQINTEITPELIIEIIKQNKELQQTLIEQNKTIIELANKAGTNKNIKQISELQKLNPEYNDPESKQNDKYQKILLNAMSGSTKEESDKNYEKIIKNVVKNTVIIK
jgi:hypothetical protein